MKYIKHFSNLSGQTEYLAEADIDTYLGYVDENDTVYYDDVIPVPYEKQYFTIESLEDGNEIKYIDNFNIYPLSASTDNGKTWTEYKASTSGTTIATLNTGKKVLMKAIDINSEAGYNIISWFNASKQFNVYGNAMSLVYPDDFIGKTSLINSRQFVYLLSDNANLISAENLVLPATTLTSYCYFNMFQNCTSLTTAPVLPATTLAQACYNGMFQGCTSLTVAPELPATTLVDACYQSMFQGCTSLTTAPALPTTTLSTNCYNGMFQGCTGLTTAPELPAETLPSNCYMNMFSGCTSINYIKCLAIVSDFTAAPTFDWVKGIALTGTFVKNAAMNNWPADDPEDFDGIPYGWTVQDA